MCREGAWAELTVQVTSVGVIRSRAHGFFIFDGFYPGKKGDSADTEVSYERKSTIDRKRNEFD